MGLFWGEEKSGIPNVGPPRQRKSENLTSSDLIWVEEWRLLSSNLTCASSVLDIGTPILVGPLGLFREERACDTCLRLHNCP